MTRLLAALCLLLAGCDDASPKDTGADSVPAVDEDGDGFLISQGDCDDANADVNPDATERCNGVDDDCDESTDEGVTATYWADADGDGYGDASAQTEACQLGDGVVANGDDCDDTNADVSPDGVEACNDVDDDCDGEVDEDVLATFYADADGDGHGDPASAVSGCEATAGLVAEGDDCDDTNPAVYPLAPETDCADPVDYNCDGSVGYADADADGWAACQDCNDASDRVRPDANERCNGLDDDCDTEIDEPGADGAEIWYWDLDGDGYGDPQASEEICEPPEDLVRDATDCDDGDASTHPDADEVCDGLDQDCDGEIDEDAVDATVWAVDADGDGYGDAATGIAACDPPDGTAAEATDCDDADATEFPGAPEYCDGDDDDCDGTVDEDDAVDALTWYTDGDGDGFGNASSPMLACDQPARAVADATDCDDVDAAVNPTAPEQCNDVDDDCDGEIDEGSGYGSVTFYADADGDGFGDATDTTEACDAPAGYVEDDTDCDDTDAVEYPGAPEWCDGDDDDCDGTIDEDDAADAPTWYTDADVDGYGDPAASTTACDQPRGYVATGDDCDDTDGTTSPAADEVCDGEDDDCDGTIDESDALDAATWYVDADGDGQGSVTVAARGCDAPPGYVSSPTDCDDGDATAYLGAVEVCDGADDDCDGTVDEADAADALAWYRDADADGYGDPASVTLGCTRPSSYVSDATDCDDMSATVSPAAAERCDGLDDDCDGTVDEADAADATTWYTDADGDGYGDTASASVACDAPTGTVSLSGDCDDTDGTTSPGAAETCDGEDDDCDGAVDESSAVDATTWYVDADGDGYGNSARASAACTQPSGSVATAGDCDDGEAASNPGAIETCDGLDDDCDGSVDESSAVDASTWYRDADADGYGNPSVSAPACTRPSGYVSDDTDCDDGRSTVSPAGTETCNSRDDDCDGAIDEAGATGGTNWYADADGDGYGDLADLVSSCSSPSGYVANSQDCDDANPDVSPSATELCDGVDDDCDGTTDESSAADASVWYHDGDGDGYGSASDTLRACDTPSNYLADASDCDDTSSSVSPSAIEICDDGVDQDCDGTADDGCPVTYTHCGSITSDTTWSGDGDIHIVTCDIAVGAAAGPTLTIEDGAIVEFYPNAGLRIGQSSAGKLLVNGTTQGVTFTSSSASPAAGDWDMLGFYTNDSGSVVDGATIEYAGAAGYGGVYVNAADPVFTDSVIQDNEGPGIYVTGFGTVDVSGTDILDNTTYGIYFNGLYGNLSHVGGPTFTDNVVSGNGSYPVSIQVSDVEQLDPSSTFSGNGTDLVYVQSGTVTTNSFWQTLDVPYYFAGDIAVAGAAGPVLTLSDGAELQFAPSAALNVGTSNSGKLVVDGSGTGVTFTSSSSSPAAGDWDGLYIGMYDLGSTLTGATVEYAGANGYGGVYLWETDGSSHVVLDGCDVRDNSHAGVYVNSNSTVEMTGNTISDNATYGVYIAASSDLYADPTADSFSGNVITANGDVPLYLDADEVGEIATDNVLTGNAKDYVYVTGTTLAESATWHALDVYYAIASDIQVFDATQPVWTIEDGADLRFAGSAGIYVGLYGDGSLVVQGSTAGVTFGSTSSSPSAGAWDGLAFYSNDQGSEVVGATIEYGGHNGYGAVYCNNCDAEGGGVSVRDSTVTHSEFAGVYVGSGGRMELAGDTISDNTTYGAYFSSNSSLVPIAVSSGWQDNVVTGNGTYPLAIDLLDVAGLDTASTYSGNGTDMVYVYPGDMSLTSEWYAIDADYYITGDVYVRNSASSPTLTLDAGVTLRFATNAGLLVGTTTNGKIVATGTSTDPVTFTSAQSAPLAGDWDGITLGYYDRGSQLKYTVVEYGATNLYGNVYVDRNNLPEIKDSTIGYSSKYGIYRKTCSPTISGITYVSNSSGDLY